MSWEYEAILTAVKYFGLVAAISAVVAGVVLSFSILSDVDSSELLAGPVPKAKQFVRVFSYVFTVALIGGLAGQLGGSSREGAVGDILPAVFTGLGGFIVYYFGEKKPNQKVFYVNSIAFLVCFFLVYNISAIWRQSNEALDFCKEIYSDAAFAGAGNRGQRDKFWGAYCGDIFQKWTNIPNQ